MIKLTRSQVQPIGLDIGLDSIKMLQLQVAEESLSVVASARQVVPEEVRSHPELKMPFAVDAIKKILRGGSFSGREIVACLPRDVVQVKNIRLPMMPPAEIESAVKFEAKNIFPFDTDQSLIRYLPAGEVRQGSDSRLEIITLAARQDDVNAFVEQLHHSGSVIASLDFEPCSIYRSVERFVRRREDEGDVHVLVEIGARRTQVLIGKGRDISFYKPIEIGSQQLQQDVSRKLGITIEEARALRRRLIESALLEPAVDKAEPVRQAVHDAIRSTVEELAREISLCLRYYSVTFRGQRPEKASVIGGEAADVQMLSILNASMPIKIVTGRPLLSVGTSSMKQSERSGTMSEWATALGLGLKMTRQYFGARDGKKRVPGFMEAPATAAEVVDLGQQVREAAHA